MASEMQRESQTLGKRRPSEAEEAEEEEEVEREIQELEREVGEMGRRILDARRTVPGRLLQALSSRFLAQRPTLPSQALIGDVADGTTETQAPSSESDGGSLIASTDQRMLDKLRVFRAKTESNISTLPGILERVNDCILRIEKLEKCDIDVHSVFNRKGT